MAGFSQRTPLPVAWEGMSRFDIRPRVAGCNERLGMKTQKARRLSQQPEPFTPGLTKDMVREHVQRLLDQRLLDHDPVTNEDWVLAERDLLGELQKGVS